MYFRYLEPDLLRKFCIDPLPNAGLTSPGLKAPGSLIGNQQYLRCTKCYNVLPEQPSSLSRERGRIDISEILKEYPALLERIEGSRKPGESLDLYREEALHYPLKLVHDSLSSWLV
jgi:hypothetical protein